MSSTKVINQYQNGNTLVTIMEDGTKIRECEGIPCIVHPESIDVKITDYCDMGCPYCHENSTVKGKHANLKTLLKTIKDLPSGVELAIGGGNPLSHPNIATFLVTLKKRGLIANITVNQKHLEEYEGLLTWLIKENLINGIGISITSEDYSVIKRLKDISENIVYHLIAGVNEVPTLESLIEFGSCKVLLLGYKDFGRGVVYHNIETDDKIKEWEKHLPSFIGKCVISFDNLAIEQLNVRRLFTVEGWSRFYMGDDFTFTMYIDAVKQEYAPTSRSNNRVSFKKCSLLDYFKIKD